MTANARYGEVYRLDRPGLISKFYKALKAGSILNISKKVDSSQADKNRSHRFRVGVGIGHSALINQEQNVCFKDPEGYWQGKKGHCLEAAPFTQNYVGAQTQ